MFLHVTAQQCEPGVVGDIPSTFDSERAKRFSGCSTSMSVIKLGDQAGDLASHRPNKHDMGVCAKMKDEGS
jgi:hypothetical protein